MPGPFVHRLDPVLADVCGVHLWWYGLSYTLGFLGLHCWLRRARRGLGMTVREIYTLTLCLALGVLLGGRLVEVAFYEWDYYAAHPLQMPAVWLGGMATHGLLLGAAAGTLVFSRLSRRGFLEIADALAAPGAWVMGLGRIGNFIDGQITGSVTGAWWGVRFPDAEGFRHPVVLYDGVKNLLLIPLLLWIARSRPARGVLFANLLFWYAFLRIFVDLFREYPTVSLGLPTGQLLNVIMSAAGLFMLFRFHLTRGRVESPAPPPVGVERPARPVQRAAFLGILLFALTIPSDWTQDVPARYGKRHPGLERSWLYPSVPPH